MITNLGNWTLASGFENLTLTANSAFSAQTGTGNDLGNVMRADGAAVVFSGLGGNDTLLGGSLGDTLNGGDGDDSLSGGAGDDTFFASSGRDRIDGGAGKDTLQYYGGPASAVVNLASGTATSGSSTASLAGIQRAWQHVQRPRATPRRTTSPETKAGTPSTAARATIRSGAAIRPSPTSSC